MLFIIISHIPYIATKVLLFGHICKYITGIIAILYKYLSMYCPITNAILCKVSENI